MAAIRFTSTFDHLDGDAPDFLLVDVDSFLFVMSDFLEQVPVVGELHDDAVG
jgi:hypothetical protein